ncbi:DUF1189 family protein [Lysinibacillus sp. 54212]|uniref:DUF1189 family protein n=1 Tax=Lysinibacillus sp. 54212 TaxID=3119829 RepID=UPI002FC8C4F3
MKHSQLFIDSLIHPKKLAAYRILPIGKVIQYVFLLSTFITVFSFGRFTSGITDDLFNIEGLTDYISNIKWLLYPFAFIFLFVMNSLLLFLRISLYALAGFYIMKSMKRRGEYRQVWRTAAFAITWATLLSVLFAILQISSTAATLIGVFITMTLVIGAFTKYPKQPKA